MARETPYEIARRIGAEYVHNRPVIPPEDSDEREITERAFEVMRRINIGLFDDIPVPVIFTPDDPYQDFEEMRRSVAMDGELRIFSGGADHPIWDHDSEVIARAVHDWHGHLHLDVPFDLEGEYRKWEHSRTHYPAFCDRVLFTEVIGQLGAAIYLEDGYDDDMFEQKVFPAPPDWIEDMARAIEGGV